MAKPKWKSAARVKCRKVKWLWPTRIPLGKVTVIAGDPGLGKSVLTLDMAAKVSAGKSWPFSRDKQTAGDVVIFSAEDDWEDTIAPRLKAAGAKLKRIHFIDEAETTFCIDVDTTTGDLAKWLKSHKETRLVIVDPVEAFLAKTDPNDKAGVRALMRDLAKVAARFNVAIVLVMHLNKKVMEVGSALYRVSGSVGFVAAARSAWLVAKDPQDEDGERRLVLPLKCNLAKTPPGMAYILCDEDGWPVMAWSGESVHWSAEAVLTSSSRSPGPPPVAREEAIEFLRRMLPEGEWVDAAAVLKAADAECISAKTLERAKKALGVQSRQQRGDRAIDRWEWSLPPSVCYDDLDHLGGNTAKIPKTATPPPTPIPDGEVLFAEAAP